jgi:flagellar protein FlbD
MILHFAGRLEMIFVTRYDGKKVVINSDLIEMIESTPDTMITMTTGRKINVKNSVEEVITEVKKYRKEIVLPLIKDSEKN